MSRSGNNDEDVEISDHSASESEDSSRSFSPNLIYIDVEADDDRGIIDLDGVSERTESNSDGDQNEAATEFNIDLPVEHNYLGDLERVSGVQYLEPNRSYTLPILSHSSLVYPGETIPMILPRELIPSTDANIDGFLFGLAIEELHHSNNIDVYGVTCQIYEKGSAAGVHVSIKTRAYQRFVIKNNRSLHDIGTRNPMKKLSVTILPEIELSHPVYGHDCNSLWKFRKNEEMACKILKHQSNVLTWPDFVYRMYDATLACNKIKKFLTTLHIDTAPMDLVSMSFWFCTNATLSPECRQKAFLTNNVLERILLVCQTLEEVKYLVCKNCCHKIAYFDSLFPMSKEGVKTNFCNSYGFVHDTHTIKEALPRAVVISGELTAEYCWFPGYKWQYASCSNCNAHLGWKYLSNNLKPKTFLGLSGKSVYFDTLLNIRSRRSQAFLNVDDHDFDLDI